MQAYAPMSLAGPASALHEESPDPVNNLAQSSLARTRAGNETIMQLKNDLALKEKIANAAINDAEETRRKLKRAENEQRTNNSLCDEAVAAALRCEYEKWLLEREALLRSTRCGRIMLL